MGRNNDINIKEALKDSIRENDKLKRLIKGLNSDLSKVRRKRHLYDVMGDAFIAAVAGLPEIKTPKISKGVVKKTLDEEVVTIMFSDSQIGSSVGSDETGGIGNYNKDIFIKRLDRFEESVGKILKYHPNPMNQLHVDFLGDIIEGSTIFKGQLRQIDMDTVEQVIFAVEHIARTLNFLTSIFDEVIVNGVVGNHGRVGEKGVNSPLDNLDYLVYKFAEERLKGNKRIRFNISKSWWMPVKKMNHIFLLAHGDDFKSWLGIPFYGALRYYQRMTKLLEDSFNKFESEHGVKFDYLEIGHHHESAQFSKIFMNGNWVGASEFSSKRLQVGGMPTQTIFGTHHIYGATWVRQIFLEDPRSLPKMRIFK